MRAAWMAAAAVAMAVVLTGCATVQGVLGNPEAVTSSVSQEQVVATATNWLQSPAVIEWVNKLLANEDLMNRLKEAWKAVAEQYNLPDWGGSADDAGGVLDSGTGGGESTLPAIGGGKTVTGWAPVNHWWNMDDATIRDGLAYMQARNVRWFCPEAVGNAEEDVLGTPAKLDRMKSRWLLTQAECKARGIWFAPILLNDNAGDGAYQNGGVKLEKRMAQAKALVDWVAKNGDKSVLSITIVSEIQTTAGKQLEAYGLAVLGGAGFRLDYNGSSRPSSKPAGYSGLRVWHTCDVNSWPSKDTVWLNDCGTSIRESVRALNLNGDLNGLGDPAKIAAKKAEAVKRKQYVFAIYGFQVKTFDKPTIDALGMPSAGGGGAAEPEAPSSGSYDLSKVTWLHTNVSGWPVTATLKAGVAANGSVTLAYDKANVWPAVDGVNANPWVFVKWKDGKTYAATWEWLRKGQTTKAMGGKSWGGHIKRSPLSGWEPKSGERVGMMVSGLARDAKRNVRERTDVVDVVWP